MSDGLSRFIEKFNGDKEPSPIIVEVGVAQVVTIEKSYGPLIFATIRLRADFQSGAWIIERERIDSLEWIEVARIPGQCDYEYDEYHPEHREIPTHE